MNNKSWLIKKTFAGYRTTEQVPTPINLDNNHFYEKKYNQILNNKKKEKFKYNYNNYLYKNVDILKDKFKEIYSFWNFLDIFNLSIKNEFFSNSVKIVKTDGRIDSEKNNENIENLNIIKNEIKKRIKLNNKKTSTIKPNKEISFKDKKTTIKIILTSLNLKNQTLLLKNKYENYISSVYLYCSNNNLNKDRKLKLINKYNYLFVNYLNIFIKKFEKTSQNFINLSYNEVKHSKKFFNYNYIANSINSKLFSTADLNIPHSNSIKSLSPNLLPIKNWKDNFNLNSKVSSARFELNKTIILQASVNKNVSQNNKIILPLFSSPILKKIKYNNKQSVILISMAKLEKYSKLIKSYNFSLLTACEATKKVRKYFLATVQQSDISAPILLNNVNQTDAPPFNKKKEEKVAVPQNNMKVSDYLIANNNLEFIWSIKKNVDFYKINLQFFNLKKKIIN